MIVVSSRVALRAGSVAGLGPPAGVSAVIPATHSISNLSKKAAVKGYVGKVSHTEAKDSVDEAL